VFAQSLGGALYQTASNAQLSAQALTPAGGGIPHNNMQPYLTMNFNIAMQGVFPPRP
jgi:microcystin-dependent protein